MPASILVVSLVALAGGLAAFLMGFSLLPTDVGMTWLKAGASLLSGGVVALTIGLATRALGEQLEALRAPVEPARPAMPALEEPPVLTPEPMPESHTHETAAPETPAPSGGLSGLALGGVAAAATATAAGAALIFADKAKAEEPAPAPEREDDLFLPDAPPQPAAEPTTLPAPEAPVAEEPAPEPVLADKASPSVLSETPALPPLDFSFERELEAFDLRLSRGLEPADPAKSEEAEAVAEPEPDAPETVEAALEPAAGIEEPAPIAAEEDEAEEAEAAVPAGLIADEDLAALETALAPLAPLDTLEVVGAYDSGGVRFTMYSDGSVNAVGAGGERRYPSLEALRKQLDSGQSAV